jgi:hypothetical protein
MRGGGLLLLMLIKGKWRKGRGWNRKMRKWNEAEVHGKWEGGGGARGSRSLTCKRFLGVPHWAGNVPSVNLCTGF